MVSTKQLKSELAAKDVLAQSNLQKMEEELKSLHEKLSKNKTTPADSDRATTLGLEILNV